MSCPDCFQGHVHEGQLRGKITKVCGLDAYVSEPPDGRPAKAVVVMIPDAFGWDFANSRLLADRYADKGDYKVYLPDFMDGHSAPTWMLDSARIASGPGNFFTKVYHIFRSLYGFIPWVTHNKIARAYPVVQGFFSQLRKDEDIAVRIGVAGFCWGGKLAIMLAQEAEVDGRPLVDAVFAGHPSWLEIPGDMDKLTRPVSIAVGNKDRQLSVENADKARAIVEALPDGAKGEVRVYENCGHGFCLRADVSFKDSEIARQAAEAEDQCVAWFNKQFKLES